jgi:glutathione S-transferase
MSHYVLHFAPDNASLFIRLVLEELGVPFDTRLVDWRSNAQHSAHYKTRNPVGPTPALKTPNGPMFETSAIALWLTDTQTRLQQHTQQSLTRYDVLLNAECARKRILCDRALNISDIYITALLRWPAIYPMHADRSGFILATWLALDRLAHAIETRASATTLIWAKGLGPTPFTDPQLPNPPEGSAI